MKAEGRRSKAPIREAFGEWGNLKIVLIALFGAVAGQAVVWYAGQFYALFFLEKTLRVDGATANIMIAIALDRKSVVSGKSVSVRVDLVGRRIIKKKKKTKQI